MENMRDSLTGLLYVILSPIMPKVNISHMEKAQKENKHTHSAVFSLYASGHKLEPISATMQPKLKKYQIL
jgi:hypothetical protein